MIRRYIRNIIGEEQKKIDTAINDLAAIRDQISEAEKRGKVLLLSDTDTELIKALVTLVNKEPDLHVQLITRDNAKLDIWVPENRQTFRTTHFTGIENDYLF